MPVSLSFASDVVVVVVVALLLAAVVGNGLDDAGAGGSVCIGSRKAVLGFVKFCVKKRRSIVFK